MKTLIVGIGTTGLSILEELEALYYTSYADPRGDGQGKFPPNVKLVAIDTDRREATGPATESSEVRVVNIAYENIQGTVHDLQQHMQDRKPLWLQECERMGDAGLSRIAQRTTAGAAHVRAAGRLSLWSRFAGPAGVSQLIQQALNDLTDPSGAPELHVYVVGSLVGGTGSSLFVDLGFLVRKQAGAQLTGLWGIALIPVGDVDATQSSGRAKLGNSFATLRELQFYLDLLGGGREEDSRWPDMTERRAGQAPYDFIFLVGGATLGLRFETVKELVALRLLLGIIAEIGGRIPAETQKGGRFAISHRFATFGLGGFYHPRREIAEATSCLLGLAAIRQLRRDPNPEEVYRKTVAALGARAKEYVADLDRLNGGSAQASLEREIVDVPDLDRFLRDVETRFSSGGTYFKVVDGNTSRVLGRINDHLQEFARRLVSETNNLAVARVALEKVPEATDALYAHWDRIGVPSPVEPWDNVVIRHVDGMRRLTGLLARVFYHFEHKAVVRERCAELLKVLKLFLLRRHLASRVQGHAAELRARVVDVLDRLVTDGADRGRGPGGGVSAQTALLDRLRELCDNVGKNPYLSEVWYTESAPRELRGFEQDVRYTLAEVTGNPQLTTLPGGIRNERDREALIAELAKNETLLSIGVAGQDAGGLWDMLQRAPGGRSMGEGLKRFFLDAVLVRIPEVDMTRKVPAAAFANLAESAGRGLLTLDPERGGALIDRVRYLVGRDALQLGEFQEQLRRVIDQFDLKEDKKLKSFVLFLWEKGDINALRQLADAQQWEEFYYRDSDTRRLYLLNTFDVERRFRMRAIEDKVRTILNVFLQYHPDRRPRAALLPDLLTVDERGVLFSHTDADGIRCTFRIQNPLDDDGTWAFTRFLDETPKAWDALLQAARGRRGAPPWRDLVNAFDTWAPECFGEKVPEMRNRFFGGDNRSGLLATL